MNYLKVQQAALAALYGKKEPKFYDYTDQDTLDENTAITIDGVVYCIPQEQLGLSLRGFQEALGEVDFYPDATYELAATDFYRKKGDARLFRDTENLKIELYISVKQLKLFDDPRLFLDGHTGVCLIKEPDEFTGQLRIFGAVHPVPVDDEGESV